jgi:hypothetical protein
VSVRAALRRAAVALAVARTFSSSEIRSAMSPASLTAFAVMISVAAAIEVPEVIGAEASAASPNCSTSATNWAIMSRITARTVPTAAPVARTRSASRAASDAPVSSAAVYVATVPRYASAAAPSQPASAAA